jgi:catechol 2,3-dioxygenase-like lactoylglutathione lyase family enzyme
MFTAGLFVLCCGTGMSNIPVAALGVAVGLLGPVVIALSSIRASRPDAFGTAHVSQSSPPPPTGFTGRADLQLVVNAQGVHNAVVRIRDANVPVGKWPDVGATLPVLIPNGNPRRLQVLWDQVRGHHDVATDDVSYSAYLEEEYVDEGADYDGYPVDEPLVEQTSVDEPVVVEEPPEREPEPARSEAPVPAGIAPAAPVSEAVTTAPVSATTTPARRRPSPRPRSRAGSVEAVVPVTAVTPPAAPTVPPPDYEPLETGTGIVEAKPATPAAVEKGDAVIPAGGLFIGSQHPPAADSSLAVDTATPPAAVPTRPRATEAEAAAPAGAAEAAVPAGAAEAAAPVSAAEPLRARIAADHEAATVEFTPVQPPTTGPAPAPLPRRVPGSTKGEPALGGIPTPRTAPADEAGPPEPNPYVASYLADNPEDSQQGLNTVHNVSVTVIVSDLRRSLTYYRDLLGLTEIDGGMGSAILVSGNARILLRQVTDTRPVDRRVVHLNLEVDDVHEAYERLRREGVEFMHPPRVVNQGEQLEQWAATLRDPDGHAIALTHWEDRP